MLKLIQPNREYLDSYLSAIEEYRAAGAACPFLGALAEDVFARAEMYRTGRGLPENRVRATYLWLVEDGVFLGEIDLRHQLNDALRRYGGHIGYGVRYSAWGRGLGTKMLALALEYARQALGLDRVLVTCDDDNIASARVIEKNGGVLQDKIENLVDGKTVLSRRYWIEL